VTGTSRSGTTSANASDTGEEAKRRPTPDDVREWVRKASRSHLSKRVLVCGEDGGRILNDAKKLLELRSAASGRPALEQLVAAAPERVRAIAKHVDGDLYDALKGAEIMVVPVDHIDEDIGLRAVQVAGGKADEFVSALIDRLSAGAGSRRVFSVPELIRAIGIELRPAADAQLHDLGERPAASLALLQHLPAGVSHEALAAALHVSDGKLRAELHPLEQAGVVSDTRGPSKSGKLLASIPDSYAGNLGQRLLEELLVWIADNPRSPHMDAALDSAVALAARLEDECPDVVAGVFRVVDKVLKRRGDKRLVFEVAQTSIRASHKGSRGQAAIEAEAIALICGRSWVYQRVGQLDKARADGIKSLRNAEEMGDLVTVAFCHKCLGRLCRVEAEEAEGSARRALLDRSVDHLVDAADRLRELGNAGEAGDAYALLGRTFLRSGELDQARAAAREARARLSDPHNKDYRDLRILEGELAAAEGDFDRAEELYTEVIDADVPDRRFSEVRGRALHERAVVRTMRGRNTDAIADFQVASETFTRLREPDHAAKSLLEAMRLEGRVPAMSDPGVRRLLAPLEPLVLVRTIECHEQDLAQQSRNALALRGDPPRAHWAEMIRLGQRMAARERQDW
jgi:tetratricopeptide (TPR) repeat protein